jgi:hypothetical protein
MVMKKIARQLTASISQPRLDSSIPDATREPPAPGRQAKSSE